MSKASNQKNGSKMSGKSAGKARAGAGAKVDGRAAKAMRGGDGVPERDGHWNLRLYVAGQSPKSMTALSNLKRLCEHHLPGQYTIEVIDLLKNPQLAQMDQILAIPTLVRKLPEPMKRVIGDLSDTERTMIGLDLRQIQTA